MTPNAGPTDNECSVSPKHKTRPSVRAGGTGDRILLTGGATSLKLRTRRVDPGFFHNEQIGHLDYQERLLFIGLWCIADREGRLEDRPLRFKAVLFPYDEPGNCENNCDPLDLEKMLESLQERGLIVRYVSEDQRFIQVLQFEKYQKPHVDETKSSIPAPTSEMVRRTGTVHSTNVQRTSNEGDLVLELDPVLVLEKKRISCPPTSDTPPASPELLSLKDLWNNYAKKVGKGQVRDLTKKRTAKARARLSEHDLPWFGEVLARAARSEFLTGWPGFSLDWLLENDTNAVKVVEGNYDNKSGKGNGSDAPPPSPSDFLPGESTEDYIARRRRERDEDAARTIARSERI